MEITIEQGCEKKDVATIIDNVLNQVFGKQATNLIYRYLERNYSLKRSEIGDKIELFARGLEDFFRSGAYPVERKILEDINYNSTMENNDETNFVTQMKSFMHKA